MGDIKDNHSPILNLIRNDIVWGKDKVFVMACADWDNVCFLLIPLQVDSNLDLPCEKLEIC